MLLVADLTPTSHFFHVVLIQTMNSTAIIRMQCVGCGITVEKIVDLTDAPCDAPPCTDMLPETIEPGND